MTKVLMYRGCVPHTDPADKRTPPIPKGFHVPFALYQVTSVFGKVSYVFETPGMQQNDSEPNRGMTPGND